MPQIDLKEDLTEDELAAWLPPKTALATLMELNGWDREQSIRALVTRLSADIVHAAAEHVMYRRTGGYEERRYRRFIPSIHWEHDAEWLNTSDVWETGDISFDVASRGAGYNIELVGRISFFDVRFKPADIDAMTAAPRVAGRRAPADPVTLARAAVAAVAEHNENRSKREKPGRPSGKAGEPVATITIRLMSEPPEKLLVQTAAALALDLMEEYRRLGLTPPSLANAEREAAGILRALRR